MKTLLLTTLVLGAICTAQVQASEEITAQEGSGRVVGGEQQRQQAQQEFEKPCPAIKGDILSGYASFGKGIARTNLYKNLGMTYTRKALSSNPLGPLAIDSDVTYDGQEVSKVDGWIECNYDLSADGLKVVVEDLYKTTTLKLRRSIGHRMDPRTCPNIAIRIFHAQMCKPDTKDPSISIVEPANYDINNVCQALAQEVEAGFPKYKEFSEQIVSSVEGAKQQFTHSCKYTWPSKRLSGEYEMTLDGVSDF